MKRNGTVSASSGAVRSIALGIVLLLSGCFLDGDDPPVASEGVFQGGQVAGVAYETPTLAGTTDAAGAFRYRAGEEVAFSIGGVSLGKAPGRERLSLVDLVPGATDESDPAVVNASRLLFSLDADCNPSNGVSVSAALRDELAGRSIDLRAGGPAFEAGVAPIFAAASARGLFACGEVTLLSADEARRRQREILRGVPQYRLAVKAGQHAAVTIDPARDFYDEGETVRLTLVPDAGWTFSTWLGDAARYENPVGVVMNADRSVVALARTIVPEVFQVPMVLRIAVTGSGSVAPDPAGGTYHADPHGYIGRNTVVAVTASPDPGWVFDHWEGDLAGRANPETIVIDAYRYVTAVFVPLPANRRSLSVGIDGRGVVRLDPPGGVYYAGTPVRLTALPDSEWVFEQWGGDLAGTAASATLTMDVNRSVSAKYVEVPGPRFTLTAETDRGTVVGFWPPATLTHAGSTVSAPYKPGTWVTVTATVRPGYTFVAWGGDLSGTQNPQTLLMDGDKRITLHSVETP